MEKDNNIKEEQTDGLSNIATPNLNYFGATEERAVVDYISSDSEIEKNRIFNSILRPAFIKMIESIIRKYNLYVPDEDFKHTFNDVISFLITKLDKFEPGKNKKAYSYYGTICKNYLLLKNNQYIKTQKRNTSYELNRTVYDEDPNKTYSLDDVDNRNLILEILNNLKQKIQIIVEKENNRLSANEFKMGNVLISIINDWDIIFSLSEGISEVTDIGDNSNKFNKSLFLTYVKNNTSMNTKEIRDALKRYKKLYYIAKNEVIEELIY